MNNKIESTKRPKLSSRWDKSIQESHLLKTGESKSADVKAQNEQTMMSRRPTRLSLLLINSQ